jgi:uncharacterized membrane protein
MSQDPSKLPPHIADAVKAIALLHAEHTRKATFSDRIADKTTAFVGRPAFLLALMIIICGWVGVNLAIKSYGALPPDPPPFAWMELCLTIVGILIAVLILASQRRADRFAQLREQMNLESTLLTEKVTRKIVTLVEELRRDSPDVVDRQDSEADEMAKDADHHQLLEVIEKVTEATVRET